MKQAMRSTILTTKLPVNISFRIGINFISYKGATAASNVPNSESIPRRINIIKKSTAQRGETSISKNASENVMKAKPGPDPTLNDKMVKNH